MSSKKDLEKKPKEKEEVKEKTQVKNEKEVKEKPKGKRSIWKIIIPIIIVIILLTAASFYIIKINEKEITTINKKYQSMLKEYKQDIEYLDTWTYNDAINNLFNDNLDKNINLKIIIDSKELKEEDKIVYDEIGNKKITVKLEKDYKYKIISFIKKKIEVEKEYNLVVKDTIYPVISGVKNKEITVGDKLDILKGITAKDEREGKIEVKYDGEVDTKKAGTYKVKIYAVDKNGNKAEKEMKITVNKKEIASSSTYYSGGSYSVNTGSSSSSSSSSSKTTSSSSTKTVSGRLAIAKQEAKRVVNRIIKPGMSDLEKATAIMNYLANVEFQHDQSLEAYAKNYGNEAYAALILKKAACSGFCKAVTLLCNEAGLRSKHINADQWTHQWNLVLIDGVWYHLDAQAQWLYPED